MSEESPVPPYLPEDKGAPRWLYWSYIILPIWGVVTFFLFWNGSHGWLDRGYWQQLEKAADTTHK